MPFRKNPTNVSGFGAKAPWPAAGLRPALGAVLILALWALDVLAQAPGGTPWPVYNPGVSDAPPVKQTVDTPGGRYRFAPQPENRSWPGLGDGGLSCVQTSFEDDAHVMLFRLGADGEVMAARTVSFHKAWNSMAASWHWVLPEREIDLAAQQVLSGTIPAERPVVSLKLQAWPRGTDAMDIDPTTLDTANSVDALAGVPVERLLKVFEPMACAAAVDAGFRPVREAARQVRVELASHYQTCDLRVELDGRRLSMRYVPLPQAYAALTRLLGGLRAGPEVVGLIRPNTDPAELLDVGSKQLLVRLPDRVVALDAERGCLLWPIPPAKSPTWRPPPSTLLRSPNGQSLLVQIAGLWGRLDPETGNLAVRWPRPGPDDGAVALGDSGAVCYVSKTQLGLIVDDQQRWVRELPGPVTAGPVALGDGFLVAGADGTLRQASATGEVAVWPRGEAEEPHELLVTRDAVYVLGNRRLDVRSLAGEVRASLEFGDTVKACLPLPAGGYVVWTGDNMLHRFADAGAGPASATRRWRTWIRGLARTEVAGKPAIVVADMAGCLSFLDPDELATRHQLELGADLVAAPSAVDLSVPWPPLPNGPLGVPAVADAAGGEHALDLKRTFSLPPVRHVLAVSDVHGFIYLIEPSPK